MKTRFCLNIVEVARARSRYRKILVSAGRPTLGVYGSAVYVKNSTFNFILIESWNEINGKIAFRRIFNFLPVFFFKVGEMSAPS